MRLKTETKNLLFSYKIEFGTTWNDRSTTDCVRVQTLTRVAVRERGDAERRR